MRPAKPSKKVIKSRRGAPQYLSSARKNPNVQQSESNYLTNSKNHQVEDKGILRDSIGLYSRDPSDHKFDKSQKTSLNLTVDNQLEQLSMNFGHFKKPGNDLRENSMDFDDSSQSPFRMQQKKIKRGTSLFDAIIARSKHKIEKHQQRNKITKD